MIKMSIILIFLIASCGGTKYPDWFTKNIANDNKIYGIGSGISLNEAKKIAANDIASQIRTVISSKTISSVKEDSRIGYEQAFIQDISSKVSNTVLPNFIIMNSDVIDDGRFIVQVYVEKYKLINEYNSELMLLDGQINNNYNNYVDSADILKKHRYMQQVLNLANQAKLLAFILSGLDYSVNTKAYIKNIVRYEEQMEKINKQMNFSIKGDDILVMQVIEKGLNDAGFNVQNGNGNENTVTIMFTSNDISRIVFDENIVKTSINLHVKNIFGDTVYNNIVEVGGSSIISIDEAKRITMSNLLQKFTNEGILYFLGI